MKCFPGFPEGLSEVLIEDLGEGIALGLAEGLVKGLGDGLTCRLADILELACLRFFESKTKRCIILQINSDIFCEFLLHFYS